VKRNISAVLCAVFFLAGTLLFSQEEGHGREVAVIINEIKQNQNVESITQIDPDLIRPGILEELGDSVMSLMIADEERHE
jgi:hypothetical protein